MAHSLVKALPAQLSSETGNPRAATEPATHFTDKIRIATLAFLRARPKSCSRTPGETPVRRYPL